jgi:hypothetical protein
MSPFRSRVVVRASPRRTTRQQSERRFKNRPAATSRRRVGKRRLMGESLANLWPLATSPSRQSLLTTTGTFFPAICSNLPHSQSRFDVEASPQPRYTVLRDRPFQFVRQWRRDRTAGEPLPLTRDYETRSSTTLFSRNPSKFNDIADLTNGPFLGRPCSAS